MIDVFIESQKLPTEKHAILDQKRLKKILQAMTHLTILERRNKRQILNPTKAVEA